MPSLLLTRPRQQSEAFAAALEAHLPGRFEIVIAPLTAIRPRPGPLELADFAALAFTSANGVAAFAAASTERGLPAFCVGASTAAAARAAGLEARSADGDAAALAGLIARAAPGRVLHLRGAEAAADLAALRPGLPVEARILYDQVAAAPPPEADARLARGGIDAAALFSPASAARFAAAARARGWSLAATTTVAISPAADAALDGLGAARRIVAPAPSREGMIAALAAFATAPSAAGPGGGGPLVPPPPIA